MTIEFSLKQGRTFNRPARYLNDSGEPESLENVVLTCQVKNFRGFEETMRIIVTDAASGRYRLSAPNGTLSWPVGIMYFDIRIFVGGEYDSTDTIAFNVERAVTVI